mgnify:CR=1 FL=1
MDFDYRLLAKYLTGMLSPEEMKQVEEWRELSIDNEEVFSEFDETSRFVGSSLNIIRLAYRRGIEWIECQDK